MSLPVTLSKTGNIPATYCFDNWDNLLQTFINNTAGIITGSGTLLTYSIETPDVSNRDRPWIRRNSDGSLDRLYIFWNGVWISPHPVPPSTSFRQLWVGSEASLITVDGGTSGGVTDVSGPFWEVDTAFAGKFPVGPGTFESGTNVNVNQTGGSEQNTLSSANIPAHQHDIGIEDNAGFERDSSNYFATSGGTFTFNAGAPSTNVGVTELSGGEGEPFEVLPPYYGVYIIKRTARRFYAV